MKKSNLFLILLAVAIGVFIQGCKNPGNKKKTQDEKPSFNIGVIAPLTGEGARYGEAMKQGIDLAIDEINKKGGFNGSLIIANYMDDKFDVKEGLNGLNYLSNVKNVPIIFGPAGSGISKALSPVAKEKKVVLFSSISTSDALKDAGDYFFRNISSNYLQGKAVSGFLTEELKVKKVGVFYENNEYGINMNKIFKDKFEGDIIYNISYEFRQSDFRNSINTIRNKQVDAIFIQGTTWGIANLIKQLKQYKIDAILISGDGGYGEEIYSIAGDDANGLYCTLPAIMDTSSSQYSSFRDRFIKNYNKNPDVYSVYSYDAVMMVFHAIQNEKPENVSGELIKTKLFETEYSGLGGTYNFDEFGDVDIPYAIYQFNKGKYSRVK